MKSLANSFTSLKIRPRRRDGAAIPGSSPPWAAPVARGPLRPAELAQASVMAALCAATAITAVIIPLAAGLSWLGSVPMGLLAYRYRVRVLRPPP